MSGVLPSNRVLSDDFSVLLECGPHPCIHVSYDKSSLFRIALQLQCTNCEYKQSQAGLGMSLKQSSRSVVYGDSHISTQNGCLAVLAIPGIPQVRRGDIHQRFKSWQAVHYNVQALGHTQQAGKICKGMTNDTEYPKLQAVRGSQHRTREGSAVYADVSSQATSKLGTYKLVL